jgi:hypothetical protein
LALNSGENFLGFAIMMPPESSVYFHSPARPVFGAQYKVHRQKMFTDTQRDAKRSLV